MNLRVLCALSLTVPGVTSAEPARAAGAPAQAPYDWTGRYRAGETAGHHVMSYTVDVFPGPHGEWQAFVTIDGHMTMQREVARGEERGRRLLLSFVRLRSDSMGFADSVAALPATGSVPASPMLIVERRADGDFALRFQGGSVLVNAPRLEATRSAIPPWGGVYAHRDCSAGDSQCTSLAIDVALEEEGWVGRVQVEGPGRSERLLARGEEGEELGLGKYLGLVLVSSERSSARYEAGVELAKLVRAADGSIRLRFGALRGPAGAVDVKADVRREPRPR